MREQTSSDVTPLSVPRMLLMGIGSSGVRAVESMCRRNSGLGAVVVDTDSKVLQTVTAGQVIHVGNTVTNGLSAGGDVELGRQSIEKDSSSIRTLLRNVDLLVIVAGLGGGTGSGAVPVITRLAREAGSLVLCMASLPFNFEGKKTAKVADEALKRIRTHADAIIRIPNEMLLVRSDTDIPAEQAFSRSHHLMADGIFSLWRLLSTTGISGLDFASVHTMLRNCDGFCHFASAEGSGTDRAAIVAEGLLSHRLLNNGKVLGKSAGIIVGLTGGHDLMLSEIEAIMNRVQENLPDEVWVQLGVAVDPSFDGCLSAMVLVAEHWREPLVDSANRQMGLTFSRRLSQEQGELPLEATGKGRFTHLDPTIHENQDLDVPTYIRRDIKLPR